MKDKLEPNMYIRTKWGYICKIININDFREPTMKYGVEASYLKDIMFIGDDDISKASHNIIDLIEVGDYVNGRLVYKNDEENYLYLIGFDADGNFYEDSLKEIKSIVTHEQMEQMAYKVGD